MHVRDLSSFLILIRIIMLVGGIMTVKEGKKCYLEAETEEEGLTS